MQQIIKADSPKKHIVVIGGGGSGIRILVQTGGLGRSEDGRAFANAIYLDTDLSYLDSVPGQAFERGGGTAVALSGADTRAFVDAALSHRSDSVEAKTIRKVLAGYDPDLIARGLTPVEGGAGSSGIRTFSACALLAQRQRIYELMRQKITASKKHARGARDRIEVVYALSADGAGGGGAICPLIQLLNDKFADLDHSVYLVAHNPDEIGGGSEARLALLRANTKSTLEELQALSRNLAGNRRSNSTLQINFLDGSRLNLTSRELVRDRARLLHGLYNLGAGELVRARAVNDETVRPRGPLVLSTPAVSYSVPPELRSFGAAVAERDLTQRMLSAAGPAVSLEGLLPQPVPQGLPQDRTQSLLASTSLAGATALYSTLQGELFEAGRQQQMENVARAEAERVLVRQELPIELGKMLPSHHWLAVSTGLRAAIAKTEKTLSALTEREKTLCTAANLVELEIGPQQNESLWTKLKALPPSHRGALGGGGVIALILIGLGEPLTVAAGACLMLATAVGAFALLRHTNRGLTQFTEKAISCLVAQRQSIGLRQELALLSARLQALGEVAVTLESLGNELQRKLPELKREIDQLQATTDDPGCHVPIRPDAYASIAETWGPAECPAIASIEPSVVLSTLAAAAEAHATAAFARLRLQDLQVSEPAEMTQLANSLLAWTSLPSGHLGSVDDLPRLELYGVANTREVVEGASEFRQLVRSSQNAGEVILFGWQRGVHLEQLEVYPELLKAAEAVRDIPTKTICANPSSEHPRPVPPAKDRDAVPHGRRVNGVNGTHEYSSVTV